MRHESASEAGTVPALVVVGADDNRLTTFTGSIIPSTASSCTGHQVHVSTNTVKWTALLRNTPLTTSIPDQQTILQPEM